jgi:uncharacterized OB-fold protein
LKRCFLEKESDKEESEMAERVPIREGLFQEGPDGGVLLGNKCKSCGQLFFPKAKLCQACLHEELEEAPLSRRGKLYSYTIAHMPSSFFPPPHAMGYVTFPEGVRVFAPLKIIEDKPFDVGMEMEVVIEKLADLDEKEVIGYVFKPV